jgi:hypothetical protein
MIWIANGVEQVSYYFTTFLGANNTVVSSWNFGWDDFLGIVVCTRTTAFLEGQIKIVDAVRSGDHSNPICDTLHYRLCRACA